MKFINRKYELNVLKERFLNELPEMMIIYGRRRVGKTELIREFLTGVNGIYLLGREESEFSQLQRFSSIIAAHFNDEVLLKNPSRNWDALLEYINNKSEKRLILIIDEFPYLLKSSPALPSIIQDYWDNKLRHKKLFLVLCGSSMGMMENLMEYKSPLYGRRTGQLLIKPFIFKDAIKFFPNYDIKEKIQAYAILGGTAAYLSQFTDNISIKETIKRNILRKDAFLFMDPIFILREELNEPGYYFSILKSIANGNTKLGNIVNDTGLSKGIVGKYLSVLIDLHLIEREVPITEFHPQKTRKGLYKIKDNFFRFWFGAVYPYLEYIEQSNTDFVLNKAVNFMNKIVPFTYEYVCREFLVELNQKNNLPFIFFRVGRWWHNENEIDIVALNEETKEILFCECKWQEKKAGLKILNELKEKAKLVQWHNQERKEYFALFSKSGFKDELKGKALLFDLNDLAREFEELLK